MSTLLFIFSCALLGLIVLSRIPGLEHLVKPLIELLFAVVRFLGEHGVSWAVYCVKLLFSTHIELVRHLTQAPEAIDPSYAMRERR